MATLELCARIARGVHEMMARLEFPHVTVSV